MELHSRLRRRMRLFLRSEHGMALPTALFATVASMGLAGAAVMSSVGVQQGSKRDHGAKNAIAAADAGASVAMLRVNRYANTLNPTTPCLKVGVGGMLETSKAELDGWCPAVTESVGTSTFSYRVSRVGTTCGAYDLCVVATGTADGVTRRIAIGFDATSVTNPGGGGGDFEGIVGVDWVKMNGNVTNVKVGVGTNGNLYTNGNVEVCGNVRYGVGKEWIKEGNVEQCPEYTETEGNVTLPPVTSFMPTDIATNNSNFRLVTCTSLSPKTPTGCQSDTFNGTWSSTMPFNPKTRTIAPSGKVSLTIGGGDYWLCRLTLEGSIDFIIAEGAHPRFFFDTPENCGLSSGSSQFRIAGNADITVTGYDPSKGQYDMPGFYFLGSSTRSTWVDLSGNSGTNRIIIYGPNSNIKINGNANYKGIIAGKTVEMNGNGEVKNDAGFEPPPELSPDDGVTLYSRQSYVECVGALASPPNANC